MSTVQYYVVVAFGLGNDGVLVPVLERPAVDSGDAVRLANRLAQGHAGALAFSRTVDLAKGHYGPAEIHSAIGLIPKDLAAMCRANRPISPVRLKTRAPRELRSPTSTRSVVIRPAKWAR